MRFARGEKLVRGINTIQVLSGDVHEIGKACSGTDKNGIKTSFKYFIKGHALTDNLVNLYLCAKFFNIINFTLHN